MPESAGIPIGFIKLRHNFQSGRVNPIDDHLGDPVAAGKGIVFVSKIYHGNFDFTAIVGVNGAGRVDQTDTVFGSQSASGANLGFISFGDGYGKPVGIIAIAPTFSTKSFSIAAQMSIPAARGVM